LGRRNALVFRLFRNLAGTQFGCGGFRILTANGLVSLSAKEADRMNRADGPYHGQDDDFGEVISPENFSIGGKVNLRNLAV
jgi:hypothetical protein